MESKWHKELEIKLTKKLHSKAYALFKKYQDTFSTSYIDDHAVDMAVSDILQIEDLLPNKSSEINLYQLPSEDKQLIHLRLFQFNSAIALSDILPLFENMDLRTFDGRLYKIILKKDVVWINDFTVIYKKEKLQLEKIKPIFKDAFMHVFLGVSENDGFNKLVLGGELNWREITILRAYAKYLHQTRFRFSQAYIEKTIANYVDIARDLVNLFILRFNPKQSVKTTNIDALNSKIQHALESITSLDDDRIMRRFWQLIQATLRTNYFQKINNFPKDYLSFKLKSDEVPELPLPHPLYEIFVYSPRFEGIHLRSAKVARGGIRWSDRLEDFRTEILGLMKAQTVKNVVIVPSGAKGGFVLKKVPADATRDVIQAEGIFCYKAFIRGLLDLTDNLKNNKVIKPKEVHCYDDDDYYLVVAADKGTASFSDIANSISKEYDFWLGDAFASGGSTGYDHKKMGITARGAWESIKRHFRELNLNPQTIVSVIGIGDMSGDVFGNGMIYSDKIKLIAAFDHRDIFLDPNPHPEKSFKERMRLFHLPTSSWQDYNAKLISKGGGVFKRSLKSITLSTEIKNALDIKEDILSLSPNELIRAILRAPVDLFFNGGIGTYVKASIESQADAGDKTNEFCRVNGDELRCRVVGEGGNLGFTQLGRVEYALHDGLINTDFIDNSAGVDCSDHEVNIKILLDQVVIRGKLTEKKRNILLADMTDEVGKLVLKDNYKQALALSFSAMHAKKYIGLYQTYLNDLESLGIVNRVVEFLPSDQAMIDRKSAGLGLTRPEMAVLLAYTKIYVKKGILNSDLPDESYFSYALDEEFPERLHQPYKKFIQSHSLRCEIIATHLSNHIVNEMGITFVYRVQTETGATVAEIIRAHAISSKIFGSLELERLIDSLGHKIEISLQYELLHYVRGLLNLSIRWFLRSRYLNQDIEKTINHFKLSIDQLKEHIPDMMLGKTKSYLDALAEQFISAGLHKDIARNIAVYRALYISLSVIDVAKEHKFDLMKTAQTYFTVGGRFNLVWFRDQISSDASEGHWNAMARLTLRDELDALQRLITVVILRQGKKVSIDKQIEQWIKQNHRPIARWEKLLQLLHGSEKVDYTMFFVALRELADLVRASWEQQKA